MSPSQHFQSILPYDGVIAIEDPPECLYPTSEVVFVLLFHALKLPLFLILQILPLL